MRARPATDGTIRGTAWKGDSTPLPGARVRVRDVETGRAGSPVRANERGEFRFDRVRPGVYVVELLSDRDTVLALSELTGVGAGDTAITFVRLTARASWFDGFFGNAAAAAISAASGLGITAVGSNGLPASPQ